MTQGPARVDGPAEAFDDAVLDRVRNGDEAAFAVAYTALQPGLRRYAASLVGQDADDVTAEAWLQIARDVRGFRGDVDGFRGWCARIVRNRALDLLRHQARRPADPVDELPHAVSPADTPHDAEARMATDAAIDLLRRLPREQAEAVLLRAVVGLDAARAGEVLGKSPTAVRVSAHRGLKRLRTLLGDAG